MAETFGERLKRLREEAGLTLEKLAEIVGSTKSYLWSWRTSRISVPRQSWSTSSRKPSIPRLAC